MNVDELIKEEKELYSYAGDDEVILSQDIYKHLRLENMDDFICVSAIASLDKYIRGFYRGELNIMGGPTKHGKTLICQTLTSNFAKFGKKCLWFTYEVPVSQFLGQFEPLPDFYVPRTLRTNSLDWISERTREAKLKYDIDFVFIDHLHYLIDMHHSQMSLEIGNVM
jgi:archaellum biogenesis ATPase FlaH